MASARVHFPHRVQQTPKRSNPKGDVERQPRPSGILPPVRQGKRTMKELIFDLTHFSLHWLTAVHRSAQQKHFHEK